ncbi:MAG: nucleoside phosphorylase [Patescibacteria group bacterium]|nr:nucleoside phosphorylase [Patescibacteria group bacterium]
MSCPNFKNKYPSKSVFTPKDFLNYQKQRGKYPNFKSPCGVIFCYSKNLLQHILKNHKTTKVEGFSGDFYLLNESGKQIGIIANFGIGAPIACTLLEELFAFGVRIFISIGEAGCLQKHIKIGDIVVCNKAIRDEGTSYHYLKPTKYAYPSKNITEKIQKTLDQLGKKYYVGTSWTIDAPYRETIAETKFYQKQGVITVEMEAAALFAVAQYRNAQIGALFTISDSLAELVWKPKFHISDKNWEVLFRVAKRVILDQD